MKHLGSRWAAVTLLLPVILVFTLLISDGHVPEAATGSTKGTLEVAFQANITLEDSNGQPIGLPVADVYQRLFLNVISVRLNPSTDPNVGEFDPHWVTIVVPSGVGSRNTGAEVTTPTTGFGNFGPSGNAISFGQARSEIQLDMNALQNGPEVFNSGLIPAKTYNQIELVLDPVIQGVTVPLCASTQPSGEGCVTYPAIFTPPNNGFATVRTTATVNVARGSFQVLPITINLIVGPAPTTGGNPDKTSVSIVPSISIGNAPPSVAGLGTLSGSVTNSTKKVSVVAEISGTNQIVASTGVVNGTYSMSLPALPCAGNLNGTLYDVYTTGAGEYSIQSGVRVCDGAPTTGVDFTIASSSLGGISGAILDACNTGVKIPSATLVLYEPDVNKNVTACTFDSLGNVSPSPGCVAVASAQSDATGSFPIPGSSKQKPAFQTIPLKTPSGVNYALKVTASGFNGLVEPVVADGKSLKCNDLGNRNQSCRSLALERGQLRTSVSLTSANNSSATNIMVMAEDQSTVGTNIGRLNIDNVGMATIPVGELTGVVTMNVPDNGTGSTIPACDGVTANQFCLLGTELSTGAPLSFDVFGQVQDLYFGVPQNATAHLIEVSPAIGGSPRCPSSPINATLPAFDCVGHGSVAGRTATGDSFSTVVLSKDGVNLMQSGVAPLIPSGQQINGFSFCVPGSDTYTLQHFEAPPNSTPVPVSSPTSVTAPAPVATSTAGCFNVCGSGSGCLLCQGVASVGLQ